MSQEKETELVSLLDSEKKNQENEGNRNEKCDSHHNYIQIAKGSLAAVVWALLDAVSKICVQALQGKVPDLQLNTMRLAASVCFLTLFFVINLKCPKFEMKDFRAVITYCLNGNVNTLALYVPVVYIPLVTFEAFHIASNILSSFVIFGIILWNKSEWNQVSLGKSSSDSQHRNNGQDSYMGCPVLFSKNHDFYIFITWAYCIAIVHLYTSDLIHHHKPCNA